MFGRSRDEPPQPDRIELIPLDRAGGADAGWSIVEPSEDASRGPRAGVVVGGAVAMIVGVALVAGLLSDDDRETGAPPTPPSATVHPRDDAATSTLGGVTAPTSHAGATAEPAAGEGVGSNTAGSRADERGFVLADPIGRLEVRNVWASEPDVVWSERFGSDVQLWASADASRSTGTWVLVEVGLGVQRFSNPPGHRVAGFGRGAMVRTTPEGITTLFVDPPDPAVELAYGMALTARGLAEPDLVAIAGSIVVDRAGTARVRTPPPGLTNVMHAFVGPGGPLWYSSLGRPVATVHYADADASDPASARWLTVSTAQLDRDEVALLPYLVEDLHEERVGTAGELLIGTAPDPEGTSHGEITVAFRQEPDGTLITIATNLPADQLGASLPSLDRASRDEWASMLERAGEHEEELAEEHAPPAWERVISSEPGTAAWSVAIARDRRWIQVMSGDGWGTVTPLAAASPFVVLPGRDRTIIVAHAATGELARVRVLQGDTVVAEASAVGAFDGTVAIAATSFDQVGPFTVEAVGPDGSILRTGSY